jgi:uncharacterized membrane protein YjjP (DUF1212 family)
VEHEQRRGRRYRVYQVIGLVLGAVFLALAVAAYFGGGGPFIALIAGVGGILCLTASIITMVRSRA